MPVPCSIYILYMCICIACKETAEREWARALNYFSLDGATTTGSLRHSTIDESRRTHALDIHHHPPIHSRISAPSTFPHTNRQRTRDLFHLSRAVHSPPSTTFHYNGTLYLCFGGGGQQSAKCATTRCRLGMVRLPIPLHAY